VKAEQLKEELRLKRQQTGGSNMTDESFEAKTPNIPTYYDEPE
jgi:hypothetical protein